MRLLAVGAQLQSGAAATADVAEALDAAAQCVETRAGQGAGAAGHQHVRDGLDAFADYHARYLRLLALGAQALAEEITGFDSCMSAVDRDLASGR
jgi:hypothetical protein